jgi:predicted peptidase
LNSDDNTVTIAYKNMEAFAQCYQFDHVFDANDSQNTVYQKSVFPLIQEISSGVNVCVMT